MKKLMFLFFITAAASISFAKSNTVCFQNPAVDATAPYILMLKNVNPQQQHLLSEDLLSDQIVTVQDRFDFNASPTSVWVLSVDPSKILTTMDKPFDKSVDSAVKTYFAGLAKKYKLSSKKLNLDCNFTAHADPRAGGSN